jgi:hypothetical protein
MSIRKNDGKPGCGACFDCCTGHENDCQILPLKRELDAKELDDLMDELQDQKEHFGG